MGWYDNGYAPYVSVSERKRLAEKEIAKLKKKGADIEPVVIEGKLIANTFWGKAWCKNLESYSDFASRLPRGRSYVRHGSVIDLKMVGGEITALVYGSEVYKVKVGISKVVKDKWQTIVNECVGKIDSIIELLQGNFSKSVMEIISNPKTGLFPHPKEIKLSCSCPDSARMCKHVAAVLYGVGARLDARPEELFQLRQADHGELIAKADVTSLTKKSKTKGKQVIKDSDLSSLFGIDLGDTPVVQKGKSKVPVKKKVKKKS